MPAATWEHPMPEDHSQPTPDDAPASPGAYLRRLQARLLAGDPTAVRELERIALLSNLETLVAEARQNGELREHRFASSVPALGAAIAALRRALYGLSARWPLHTLIEQQNRFNRAASQALAESLALNRRLLERIEQLEARVTQLERERSQ